MNLLSFCQGTFDWVWKTSIAAAILAALVLLVQWLLGKRLTPRLHYALSLLVLIRLLMPALPASSFSLEKFLPQKTRIVQPVFHAAPVSNPIAPKATTAVIANSPAPLPIPIKFSSNLSIYCAMWLLGCLLLVALATWRYSKWVRWINEGKIISDPKLLALLNDARKDIRVRHPVKIVAIPQVAGPAVFGIWNIRLLLPENIMRDLSDDDLRLIFRHEMAHVRRYDVLLNTVLMAVQFLHWFNPVIWLALHRIRADRETICDEMVMRHTEAEERARYGRLLLKLIEEFPNGQRLLPNTATMVGSQHEIKRRIIMIKNHGRKRLVGAMFAVAAIALLGCASFTHSANSTSFANQPKPNVVAAPSSPEIQSGNNAAFTVVPMNADGTGPFVYKWNFNTNVNSSAGTTPAIIASTNQPLTYQWDFGSNSIVSGATTPIVVANNSSSATTVPSSSGSVVAVVSPSNCPPGSNVPLTVNYSVVAAGTPTIGYQWTANGTNSVITNQPPGTTVPATANFTVAATGSPTLYYQWYTSSNLPTGTLALVSDSNQAPSLASQLIGTWVLEREDGPQSSPSGVGIRMKNFTGTHWNIIQPDSKTGEIIFNQGGTYKIEGDKYFEHKDFAGEHNKGGIGKTGEFTLKIEGDKLIQKGINNDWNEVWKRVQQ